MVAAKYSRGWSTNGEFNRKIEDLRNTIDLREMLTLWAHPRS